MASATPIPSRKIFQLIFVNVTRWLATVWGRIPYLPFSGDAAVITSLQIPLCGMFVGRACSHPLRSYAPPPNEDLQNGTEEPRVKKNLAVF
jgi:hypothetical protein